MKNVLWIAACVCLATNASAQSPSNLSSNQCDERCEEDAALWIGKTLEEFKDPFTARIRNLRIVEYTHPEMASYVCAEINAKNTYGGYAGWKLYSGVGKGTDLSSPRIRRAFGDALYNKAIARQRNQCSLEPIFFIEDAKTLNPYSSQ